MSHVYKALPSAQRYVHRTLSGIAWILVLGAIFLAWPVAFGGQTGYTVVVGHSMDPTYHTGDLVITRPQDTYQVGDIVVYRVPAGEPAEGRHVIHRLIDGSNEEGWVSQGDNNDFTDIWTPHDADMVGGAYLHIPYGGYVLLQARNPLVFAVLGGIYVGYLLWPRKEKHPEEPADASADNPQEAVDSSEQPVPAALG